MEKIFFYFKCILCTLVLFGCKNYCQVYDEIVLPQWPPDFGSEELYPELSRWKIEVAWLDSTGKKSESFLVGKEVEKFKINIPWDTLASIVAQPITVDEKGNETVFFYPCGMIYPFCNSELQWESGFEAKVLQSIILNTESGDVNQLVWLFNWNKMDEIIKSRINNGLTLENDKFYNPWHKNPENIVTAIINKKMTATELNDSNSRMMDLKEFDFSREKILSPFVIENEIIEKTGKFWLSNDEINFYSIYNEKCVIIYGKFATVKFAGIPLFVEKEW